jgi:hypothetical protein
MLLLLGSDELEVHIKIKAMSLRLKWNVVWTLMFQWKFS